MKSQEPSYSHGTSSWALYGATIGQHFDQMVKDHPDNDALISLKQNIRLSYAQLQEAADVFSLGLIKLGIEKGDRVGIWSPNNAEWVITQLGAAKCGAILVNINPAYKTGELAYALKQAGVKLLVTAQQHKDSNYLEMLQELKATEPQAYPQIVVVLGTVDNLYRTKYGIGDIHAAEAGFGSNMCITFDVVTALGKREPIEKLQRVGDSLQFDDAVNIQYTSGTTGFPKGVTLSHHNLVNNAYAAGVSMGLSPSSRFCVPMPFYHCGGMVTGVIMSLMHGSAVIIPGPSYEAGDVLEAIEKERCTHLSGVPTMFIGELEHPEFAKFDLSSLRGGFMAGAPCPVELMKQVSSKLHMQEEIIIYGLTEASPAITTTIAADSLLVRTTTVGKALPYVEIKVVDPNTGVIVPRGEQGEICTRGYLVMLGYWNNEEATKQCINNAGWLSTGDLGHMTEDGYINITGRKKDMIIRGGENIYPREIEEVLHTHPSIAQAYIFGVPDLKFGEEVCAWVQLKEGTVLSDGEFKAWLKERVAHFKIPRHVSFVTAFPMTVTGKIQKFRMREAMIEQLGLTAAASITTA